MNDSRRLMSALFADLKYAFISLTDFKIKFSFFFSSDTGDFTARKNNAYIFYKTQWT